MEDSEKLIQSVLEALLNQRVKIFYNALNDSQTFDHIKNLMKELKFNHENLDGVYKDPKLLKILSERSIKYPFFQICAFGIYLEQLHPFLRNNESISQIQRLESLVYEVTDFEYNMANALLENVSTFSLEDSVQERDIVKTIRRLYSGPRDYKEARLKSIRSGASLIKEFRKLMELEDVRIPFSLQSRYEKILRTIEITKPLEETFIDKEVDYIYNN